MARRMPNWLGSIRFRLTAIYSSVLFLLAAVMLGGVYFGLERSLAQEQVYERYQSTRQLPDGRVIPGDQIIVIPDLGKAIEHDANERAVELMREYTFGA